MGPPQCDMLQEDTSTSGSSLAPSMTCSYLVSKEFHYTLSHELGGGLIGVKWMTEKPSEDGIPQAAIQSYFCCCTGLM